MAIYVLKWKEYCKWLAMSAIGIKNGNGSIDARWIPSLLYKKCFLLNPLVPYCYRGFKNYEYES